jgi:hypothetical protein
MFLNLQLCKFYDFDDFPWACYTADFADKSPSWCGRQGLKLGRQRGSLVP